ncbi:hypothetical protein D3C81_2199740 [compost metagenome]
MAMGVATGALLLRLSMGIQGNAGTAGTGDFQLTFLCVAKGCNRVVAARRWRPVQRMCT